MSYLEETIEAILRENRQLKDANMELKSVMATVHADSSNTNLSPMKKKKRLRTVKPISFQDTDFSDDN